jgi:serine/threonine-protein kinase
MNAPTSEIADLAKPGQVLMGKYRVERVLGIGGMGAVVEARHIQLDDRVAIKFLLSSMSDKEEVVTRFLREGRAAAKIRNEHVVRVFDVGTLENGAPYMVMEFLQGSDLSALIEQHGKAPVAQAVDWVLEACEAIAEAHAAGIVHRDVKPANLFLAERNDGTHTIKVLDFGISKLSEAVDQQNFGMTKTQAVMGSPRYMSPEQMRSSRNVDARSDIWALGVVLHELLAGVPPFDAETMPELCAKILAEPPPPLRAFRNDLPPGLEEVLAGALQKDPQYRYQSVAQLAAALAPFGGPAAAASANRALRLSKMPMAQSDPNARLSRTPSMLPSSPPPPMHGSSPPQAWGNGSRAGTTAATRSRGAGLWIGLAIAAVAVLGAVGVGGLYVLRTTKGAAGTGTDAPVATAPAPPASAARDTAPPSPSTTATVATTADTAVPASSAASPLASAAASAARPTGTLPGATGRPVAPNPVNRPPAQKPGDDDIPSTRQ